MRDRLVNVLGKGGHSTVAVNGLESLGKLVDKDLVLAQVITEQVLDVQERVRLVTTSNSASLQILGHRVVNGVGAALLVDTVQVAEPAGNTEDETLEVVGASHDLLSNGGHDELRQLARAVEGQTVDLVHDGRVGESLHQLVAVGVDADTRNLGQQRLDLLLHHVVEVTVEGGVLDNLVNVLETAQESRVGHSCVRGVEETQLVALKLLNIRDAWHHLSADLLKSGATIRELVLDDPLLEGLRDDGPSILNAKLLSQVDLVNLSSARRNTVDHAVGECTVLLNPFSKLGITVASKSQKHVLGDGAVLLHIVARQHGKGLQTSLVTLCESSVQVSESGAGSLQVASQIGDNVGVLNLKLVSVFIVVVTSLSNRHGDDLSVRVRHLVNDLLGSIGSENERVDSANDARVAALSGALNDSVQAVLGNQGVAHGSVKGLQTDTANGPVAHGMLAHQAVDIDGQMSSVETTDANVNNTLLDTSSVKGWAGWHSPLVSLTANGIEVVVVELDGGRILLVESDSRSRGAVGSSLHQARDTARGCAVSVEVSLGSSKSPHGSCP